MDSIDCDRMSFILISTRIRKTFPRIQSQRNSIWRTDELMDMIVCVCVCVCALNTLLSVYPEKSITLLKTEQSLFSVLIIKINAGRSYSSFVMVKKDTNLFCNKI